MQKRILIYFMLFTFGLLIIPKSYLHDCLRQHEHVSDHSEDDHHKHSSHEANFSTSDNCSICDFQFFAFGIHHFSFNIFIDKVIYVSGLWLESPSEFSVPKHLLRGPPVSLV